MKSVQAFMQFVWKWKQIEDNFTGDIIGKVDQLLGNETNNELWKAFIWNWKISLQIAKFLGNVPHFFQACNVGKTLS